MADCGKGCAKCMLLFFNVIFILTGAALFAIGLWIRLDNNIWQYIGFVSLDKTDPYIEYGAYLLIAVGAFIMLTSILGCCGACTERKFCLGLYIFILVIVLICEIAGGVMIILYQNKIKNEFRDLAVKEFNNGSVNYFNNTEWSGFATTMNLVQHEFTCCGIKSSQDYTAAGAPSSVKTCGAAPCSCYPLNPGVSAPKNPNDLTASQVNTTAPYPQGCETAIIDFFEKYSVIFIGLAIGFACIEVFGLIFAICVCQLASRSSKYTE